jgi:hypothetical protein
MFSYVYVCACIYACVYEFMCMYKFLEALSTEGGVYMRVTYVCERLMYVCMCTYIHTKRTKTNPWKGDTGIHVWKADVSEVYIHGFV